MILNTDTDPVKTYKDPTLQRAANTIFNANADGTATKIAPGTASPLIEIKAPEYFGLDETNYYRYARRSNFDELGFTPYADNEALYNSQASNWGEIGRGLQGLVLNTGTTAMDMAEGSYDIITGNWGKLFESDPIAAQNFEDINRLYGSSKGGVTEFLANNAINLGFMTGMIAEGLAEGALISLATGSPAGFGLTASKIAQGAKIVDRASTVLNNVTPSRASNILNAIGRSTPDWIKSGVGGTGKLVLPNATEFISDAFKAASIGEQLPSAARGAGAFFKEVQTLKAASTEAALEGGFVQNKLFEKGVDLYYQNNGTMPGQAELDNIMRAAKEAGDKSLMANLPVIYLTDAIVFKSILGMGKTTSRVFGTSGDMSAKLSNYGIKETAGGLFEEINKKGFRNGLRNTFSPGSVSRLGRNVFLPAISEGLQENFQEVVSQSYKDYYSTVLSDPLNIPFQDMKGTFSGIGEIFNLAVDSKLRQFSSKAVGDQFSQKGLETFLSGAFIGGLGSTGGSKIAEWSKTVTAKGRQERDLLKTQEAGRRTELINILNEASKDVYSLFNPRIKNYIDQSKALSEWQQAKGDEKKQKDIVEEIRYNHLMTVLQTGQIGNFKEKLNALLQLDDTGIVEATGLDNATEGRERISQTLAYADNLEKQYKTVEKEYGNPFDASQYATGSEAYERVRTNYFVYEAAKRDLIFLEETQAKTKERLESIRTDISKRNASNNTTSSDIDVLTSTSALQQELDLLSKEVLAEAITPEQKQVLSEKKQKRKALDKYRIAYSRYEKLITGKNASDQSEAAQEKRENAINALKDAYKNFITTAAKGSTISEEKIEKDIISIIDSIALNRDQQGLIGAINNLNSPERLTKYAIRNAAVLNDVIVQKKDYIAQSLNLFKRNLQKNQSINAIYQSGYFMGSNELKEFFETGKIPTKLYTVRGSREVDVNSEEAVNVKEILTFLSSFFKKEDVSEESTQEAVTEEVVPGVTPVSPEAQSEPTTTIEGEFTEDLTPSTTDVVPSTQKIQYTELPAELKKTIDNLFKNENDRRAKDGENLISSVSQYTMLPTPQRIIKEYFDANPPVDETAIVPATAEEAFETGRDVQATISELESKKADIEKRRQEELKKFGTSEKKTSKYNIKLLGINEYVSRELMELAYSNDWGNNPKIGGTGQTLDRIIERGGYSKEELIQYFLKPEISKINAKYDAELAALSVDSKNNRIYLNLYTEQIEKATSLKALNKLEVDISTDSKMPESQANKNLARITERKAELGAEVGEVIPPVAEEEKKLAEQSIPTSEDLIAKTNLTIEDAANKSKDDLDDDFFDNINEC